jgi:hypothetical protein
MRTSALVVTAVAAFAHAASAQLIHLVTVELSVSNNTLVQANVTNTGNSIVKLLTVGSLLSTILKTGFRFTRLVEN